MCDSSLGLYVLKFGGVSEMSLSIIHYIQWGYCKYDEKLFEVAVTFKKKWTFPIKRDSSYYQGTIIGPSVAMVLVIIIYMEWMITTPTKGEGELGEGKVGMLIINTSPHDWCF